ncbi:MAG: ABC transporter substrate-binding protein [Bifidobacteriaceae bacterium]|jgi:raffinose/stachyose/melibiose transport system substrate-binding protein|nr:ABC transporter substrate-binding protein [Bifidobacteriaceae bacterium]
MKRQVIVGILATLTLTGMAGLTACGDGGEGSQTTGTGSTAGPSTSPDQVKGSGTVHYINAKPEIADKYEEVAADFLEETGITLKVVTAASGTYEQQLTAEMGKSTPPDLFQINSPQMAAQWQDYTADLAGTSLYGALTDKTMAITSGNAVVGLPYVVEGYGIIYNDAIMKKYFALADKAVDVSDASEIKDFATLQAVVEDMQAKKDALGIKGVFASTSMKAGEDWRWNNHLIAVPLTYEWEATGTDLSQPVNSFEFTYNKDFQNLFDLYLNNSTVAKGAALTNLAVGDSMAEFALGQAAMAQNGNWAWSQIDSTDGNVVLSEDIKYLPLYTGQPDDASRGLAIGTDNYYAINSQVSAEQQQLAADFIWWLFNSETGKRHVVESLGFIAPFETFDDTEVPDDPLAKEVKAWMGKDGVTNVAWGSKVIPNQAWKDNFTSTLTKYILGEATWDEVAENSVEDWSKQAKLGAGE